jgi:hypothetical protein
MLAKIVQNFYTGQLLYNIDTPVMVAFLMQWSKLKKTIESRFARSVRGKVHLHTTQYGCQCGRGWITYNGAQIANFETLINLTRKNIRRDPTNEHDHVVIESSARIPGQTMSRGEFCRQDLHKACWELLNMPLNEALSSNNPVIQGLAFLDQRLGKQRAISLMTKELHPLASALLTVRITEDSRQPGKDADEVTATQHAS